LARIAAKLLRVGVVLWAGSLWSLAAWVAPTLFYAQPDRHVAGVLAARLFLIETYLSLALGVVTLLSASRVRFSWLYAAMAVLCVNEWLLKPLMERAHVNGQALGLGFGAWHGVSALLYFGACVLALALVWNDDLR